MECHGRKLVVNGREEHKISQDDYSKKEFKVYINTRPSRSEINQLN